MILSSCEIYFIIMSTSLNNYIIFSWKAGYACISQRSVWKHLVLLRTHCWTPYFSKAMILIDFTAAAELTFKIKMSSC